MTTDDLTTRINTRRDLEAELAPPQPQTGAWLTDDGSLLVRKYGDTMTVTRKVDGRWLPEMALTAEAWDFGASA